MGKNTVSAVKSGGTTWQYRRQQRAALILLPSGKTAQVSSRLTIEHDDWPEGPGGTCSTNTTCVLSVTAGQTVTVDIKVVAGLQWPTVRQAALKLAVQEAQHIPTKEAGPSM